MEGFWERLSAALARIDPAATTPPPDARVGAVLVLFEDTADGPTVVLTRRRADLPSHPGQVSFAGGRVDPGEAVEEAALREAAEEIGVRPDSVELVGVGPTFYIPPSRFWVVPVVARWRAPHPLRPNPWEVDAVLRVPLRELLDPARWRSVPLSDGRHRTWAWQLDDDLLWGATAMVLASVLDVALPGWSGGTRPEDLPADRIVRPWEQAPEWSPRARLEGVPELPAAHVPHVTAAQMAAVDHLLEGIGLGLVSLVEQGGRALAEVARRLLGGDLDGRRVVVLAGPGGNGAGGLVAARLLAVGGAEVTVCHTGRVRLPAQLDACRLAGARLLAAEQLPRSAGDLVVDALLGYSARPGLDGWIADAVGWLRRHDALVLANDLPSGLHADRGLVGPCVTADVTVTLAAPKVGMRPPITHPYLGDLYLADLGVPRGVWTAAGLEPVEVFAAGPLVRLRLVNRGGDAGTPEQAEPAASPTAGLESR